MTKSQLVTLIAQQHKLSRKDAASADDTVFDSYWRKECLHEMWLKILKCLYQPYTDGFQLQVDDAYFKIL